MDTSPSQGYPQHLDLPVPIYTPGWKEALWESSVLPKNQYCQYSDKFMHGIVLHSIVLLCSLLYCIVNLLLDGYNTIQCHA